MEEVFLNAIGAASIPLALVGLQRLFPSRQLTQPGPTLEELKTRYQRWEICFAVLYLLLIVPATAAVYLPLYGLSWWRAQQMAVSDDTLVYYTTWPLLLPAMFLGFVVAYLPVILLQRLILRERSAEYDRYVELKSRYDINRVSRFLIPGLSVIFVVGVLALLGDYVVAASDKLVVNPFLGFQHTYAYSDITSIETAPRMIAPNGELVERRTYVVRFKDGRTFDSNYLMEVEWSGHEPIDLIHAIAERSKLPLVELAVFDHRWF